MNAVKKYLNVENYSVETIGTRHGEKLHETLLSIEEFAIAEDLNNFYKISPDLRNLNYEKFYESGVRIDSNEDYNSSNTRQLKEKEIISLLEKISITSIE